MSTSQGNLTTFSENCPAAGDYGQPLTPERFHINGMPGAPPGCDIIVATFDESLDTRGRTPGHSADAGDEVSAELGERFRALTQDQIHDIGRILCERVRNCPGRQLDREGVPFCPAFNYVELAQALNQVSPSG